MNQALKDWHNERLPQVQLAEARRVALDHIKGIRERADKLDEPMRTELHSVSIAMENLLHYVDHVRRLSQ